MSAAEKVDRLFSTLPPVGENFDWFVNQLLAIVAEVDDLTVRRVPDYSTDPPHWESLIEALGQTVRCTGPVGVRLFRPLLARLAVIAAEETGTPFQPYGGSYSLVRPGPTGPIQFDVTFSNTLASSEITFIRRASVDAARTSSVLTSAVESQLATHPAH